MLTDIFAHRYADVLLFDRFGEAERRLIVQAFRILSEQICPYHLNGKEHERGKAFWVDIQGRLAMELGLKSLSPTVHSYQAPYMGKQHTYTGSFTMHQVCETWMLKENQNPFDKVSADQFNKERLSLVEIGFRKREEELAQENAQLPQEMLAASITAKRRDRAGFRVPGDPTAAVKAKNDRLNAEFRAAVDELNTRFGQAGFDLHYHNGFIQRSTDTLLQERVEEPFWALVGDPKWQNVDTDMKEAVDRRDTGGRDAVFYAARALESTIKIVSDDKGWSHGGEKGAHGYIDNLASRKNGLLDDWERENLKAFFTSVRNRFGHGPGSAPMPSLSPQQTDWAIEFCMSWIKSLIRRV